MSKNKTEKPRDKVVITHLSPDKPKEEVYKIVKRSRVLINGIIQYVKELKQTDDDLEVIERNVNIILTNKGYYCAFFESDMKKQRTKKPEDFAEPFKGFDGRLKVKLKDKDGEDVIEDLAILVAKTFIANPEKYEFVKFIDKDSGNCAAHNLYWSETE